MRMQVMRRWHEDTRGRVVIDVDRGDDAGRRDYARRGLYHSHGSSARTMIFYGHKCLTAARMTPSRLVLSSLGVG